jgi:hypothetical protein
MPETVPRWLLVGAGIVALLIVLVEVKDFAERKSASSPPPGTSSATTVSPDIKSAPKKTAKTKPARASADAAVDSEAESDSGDALENTSTLGGIEQAGERDPVVSDDDAKSGQPEAVKSPIKTAKPRCSPLPNSTKPEDVDAPYYKNWAREYGCGLDGTVWPSPAEQRR